MRVAKVASTDLKTGYVIVYDICVHLSVTIGGVVWFFHLSGMNIR